MLSTCNNSARNESSGSESPILRAVLSRIDFREKSFEIDVDFDDVTRDTLANAYDRVEPG